MNSVGRSSEQRCYHVKLAGRSVQTSEVKEVGQLQTVGSLIEELGFRPCPLGTGGAQVKGSV